MKNYNELTINFLGDSITEGAAATSPEYMYTTQVAKKLGCTVNNYGIGGTRIARQKEPTISDLRFDLDYVQRADDMDVNADLVFVFGGTNDFGHGDAAFGDIDSDDVYTFYGAMNTLVSKLIARYGKDKICFIMPLHRYNENNPYGDGTAKTPRPTLGEYVAAEIAVLNKRGVKYVDFRNDMPLPTVDTPTEYYQDGLHPTDKGHELLADLICNYIKSII